MVRSRYGRSWRRSLLSLLRLGYGQDTKPTPRRPVDEILAHNY